MVASVCRALLTCVPLLWLAAEAGVMPDPAQRDLLMLEEALRQTGGKVVLTAEEQKLDARLRQLKEKEMLGAWFPPAMHFFKARALIQRSPIFKLLQKMPKGELTYKFAARSNRANVTLGLLLECVKLCLLWLKVSKLSSFK